VQQAVGGGEPPARAQRLGIRPQVPVAQHRPLRAAGRARSVQDRGKVIVPASCVLESLVLPTGSIGQAAAAVFVEREQLRHAVLAAQLQHHGFVLRTANQQRRLGIAEEIADLGHRVGGAQREVDGAEPQRGEIDEQCLGALLDMQRDPVALAHAERSEQVCESGRARQQLGIG
jgi:hypothetical protein